MGRGMRARRNVTSFLLIVNNDIKFLVATILCFSSQKLAVAGSKHNITLKDYCSFSHSENKFDRDFVEDKHNKSIHISVNVVE